MLKVSPVRLFPRLFNMKATEKVIYVEQSSYSTIMVVDHGDLRCLKFSVNTKNVFQSCYYKRAPSKLVLNYTKLLFSGLLINDSPKNVLIIGLGGGILSNTLHTLYPESKITNVEIDPVMTKVARDYFNFFESDEVISINQDGRLFVQTAQTKKQTFDWIILDAFDSNYIPEHLVTKDFLEEVKSLLTNDGVLSANTFINSALYDRESATYHSVFGDFFNVRNEDRYNRIILTSKQNLPTKNELTQRRKTLEKTRDLSVYDINLNDLEGFLTSTKEQHDWPKNTLILTDKHPPIGTG